MLDLLKNKVLLTIIMLTGTFMLGRSTAPVKVDEKEKIVKQTEYIVREIKQPDGTIVKEVIHKDTASKEKEKSSDYQKPQYKVSLIPKYDFNTKEVTYGATVEKRVLGNMFLGIYADNKGSIGASISTEF